MRPEDQLECLRREATKPSREVEGLIARLEQDVRDHRCAFSTRTVWADASDVKEAIFSLLDGKRVYDTSALARMMTGREPVEVTIVARRRTPVVIAAGRNT